MISTTKDSKAAQGLLATVRRLKSILDFAFETWWVAAVPSLFVVFYTFLICYVMVLCAAWGLGVSVWLIPVAFMSPVIYAWYKILERRYRAYLAMMMSTQPANWNTDAAIESWLKLTKAKRQEAKARTKAD